MSEAEAATHLFTVPVGRPFLDAVAEAILAGHLPSRDGRPPELIALPGITLLMPTPRAARALRKAFLIAGGGRAMLLPRIRPISEIDEELSLLTQISEAMPVGAGLSDVPQPIGQTERLLTLTQLVMRWSETMRSAAADPTGALEMGPVAGTANPAHAVQLARELARLMDMVETERQDLSRLGGIVPDEFAEHWKKTLEFLQIVTQFWPAILADRGLASPADARNQRILAEARRLTAHPPQGPVIVAGVTGSVPATLELMRAVAALPQGAIVLPALDTTLDDDSWAEVAKHAEHPQFGLAKMLDALGAPRTAVTPLGGIEPAPHLARRNALVSEALRPASTTGRWHHFVAHADRDAIAGALDGVALIEAPGADDEAEAVALILREVAETPGRTAALVSPDRRLARRVAVRLQAWGIRVDDSAGRPLAKTPPGAFLDLVAQAVATGFAPGPLMALLKHPLTRLGLDPFRVRRAARALEIAAFRNVYLGQGIASVRAALERAIASRVAKEMAGQAVRRLWDEDLAAAQELVGKLERAFAPLIALHDARGKAPFTELAAAHLAVAEAVAELPANPDGSEPPSELWKGDAGELAANVLRGLVDESLPPLAVAPDEYADVYRTLISGESLRPRVPLHPRLFIWGPLEARLQQTDVVILGSLNDGTWPEVADPGPWLNRPMRQSLGLPSPEERIGHAAHDFTSQLGAERVYLTRALKVDGVPTVPSRWLMRLQALLTSLKLDDKLKPADPWLAWARQRDAAVKVPAARQPEPKPPLAMRPRKMSVSGVETWITNPYAIFARHVLGLEPMPLLGQPPDASVRGSIVHMALAQFATSFPEKLPSDPGGELARIAREILLAYTGHPRVAAFWHPRFERFARWFGECEAELRGEAIRVAAEVPGKLSIPAPGGAFLLTARADRIDITPSGLVITDYKTGRLPPDTKVNTGQAPQLPLEAAVALAGGFPGLGDARVLAIRYISATGGEPAGKAHTVKCDDVAGLAESVRDGLQRLVTLYDDPETPYAAVRRSGFSYEYDDFAHLARVAEWSAATPEEE